MEIKLKDLNLKLQALRGIDQGINDRLTYAVKKNLRIIEIAVNEKRTDFQGKLDDVRIKYAAVDEKGNLNLTDKGEYQYSRDNLLLFNKESRELTEEFNNSIIHINPYSLTDPSILNSPRVDDIDEMLKEDLQGILFM